MVGIPIHISENISAESLSAIKFQTYLRQNMKPNQSPSPNVCLDQKYHINHIRYISQQDGLAYLSREKGGGWDQIALIRYVWPWAKHVTLAHDSYTCKKFSNTHAFPTVSFGTSNIIYFSSI